MPHTEKTKTAESLAELKALSGIIRDSIRVIESTLSRNELAFPSSATPVTMESEAARMIPEVENACSLLVSAATQIVFVARSPTLSALAVAMQYNLSAALGAASAANAAEACREAGPQGAHVKNIARASSINPSKLGRILRILASNHIFIEVSPDVFANNRISSVLDTGKSVKQLKEQPEAKHVGTNGLAAAVEHITDSSFKSSAYLRDVLLDPEVASSQEPTDTALNRAFNTSLGAWTWQSSPGNEHRLLRFGIAMEGAKRAASPKAILKGFDWAGLKEGALVVDVGGGIGSQSLTLVQAHPHLRVVIQDSKEVIRNAFQFWEEKLPGVLKTERVVLQVHDFFQKQSVKNADVFLLRNIIHDWSDKYCIIILKHLREAATPTTRLVIVDSFMTYACEEDSIKDIPGAERTIPPPPLLPNGGHSNAITYFEDIMMLETLNGQERTISEVRELMKQTGWILAAVDLGSIGAFSTQKAIGIPTLVQVRTDQA